MKDFSLYPSPIHSDRDVLLFELEKNQIMVIGCEAAGGIGPKKHDKVKVNGYILGRFSARVALMEVLSVGAKPICLVDTLAVEMDPTGKEIIKGVMSSVEESGLDPKFALTGGTENNFKTEQTGVGITAIGFVRKNRLRIGTSRLDDVIVTIGLPSVGMEVIKAEKERKIADLNDLKMLLDFDFIHDIIPIGSEGIKYEIDVLAKNANLHYDLCNELSLNLEKSAGPATVILCSVLKNKIIDIKKKIKKPIEVLGRLVT